MHYTYDNNENGCLIIYANESDIEGIRGMLSTDSEDYTENMEYDALESMISNSELCWVRPEEIGALTSAPILGFRDENGVPTHAWGFMDYPVRSFLQDLVETGKAVFARGVLPKQVLKFNRKYYCI